MIAQENVVKAFLAQAKSVWKDASKSPYASVNHLALYVPNLEEAEEHIRQAFGIQPTRMPEDAPAFCDQRYSVFWQGDCYWELIEPRQSLDSMAFTLPHPFGYLSEVGYFIPNLAAEVKRLTKLGWVIHSSQEGESWREVHIRPKPASGFILELIEFFG